MGDRNPNNPNFEIIVMQGDKVTGRLHGKGSPSISLDEVFAQTVISLSYDGISLATHQIFVRPI